MRHEQAAVFWDERGDRERADLERRAARIEREAARLEADRAALDERRGDASRPLAEDGGGT